MIFVVFLSHVRISQPSQETIDDALSHLYISASQVLEYIDESTTILCTHCNDTIKYNKWCLRRLFPESAIRNVEIDSSAINVSEIAYWIEDDTFHTLKEVVIGA